MLIKDTSSMSTIHFVCGMVYLGIAFSFRKSSTHAYVAWFVIGAVETILNIGLSLSWDVLSFQETHLTNRMVLLTFIILGEGIIVVCKAVANIARTSDSWSKQHCHRR